MKSTLLQFNSQGEFDAFLATLRPWAEPFPCPNSGAPGYVSKSLAQQRAEYYGTQTQRSPKHD